MILTSPSFEHDSSIPRKFTCDGGGINPEFQVQYVPENAKSLALIVHDPDAPIAGGFTHWVVWNIDPRTTLIKEESTPPGAGEGLNGARRAGYAPPCPPPGHGLHHYHFKLYALDTMLDLAEDTMAPGLEAGMKGHVLAETELVGTYKRE
jgi:Raf kinase inhibitor-like YbhB/YbcL family protein